MSATLGGGLAEGVQDLMASCQEGGGDGGGEVGPPNTARPIAHHQPPAPCTAPQNALRHLCVRSSAPIRHPDLPS